MQAPRARTFGGLLREMSERFGDRPAVISERGRRTYRELDREVDGVSRGLLGLGVRRGEVVSVLAGNRIEWLLCAMGAARIGAVVAPLNTWYKPAELAYQLRHAEVKVLFTVDRLLRHDYAARLQEVVPSLAEPGHRELHDEEVPSLRHVVALEGGGLPGAMPFEEFLAGGEGPDVPSLEDAEAAVRPEDLLYILYTSGSTAAPKGVLLHHGDAIENDFNIGERQHMTFEDRVWLGSPFFYAFAAVNAVPAAWTHGACVLIQDSFDAGRALEQIERERATVFYGQGHVTRALLSHPDYPSRDVSSLSKGVISRSRSDKQITIEVLGVERACSMYGLTEAYGHFAVTDADDPLEVKLETQGRPLPGWEYRVVEPGTDRDVPAGTAGELWIRGYVTTGYYKDPEQTAAAFAEGGWFRTGDLVLIDDDGRMRFQSRLKELVKVGGINVAPAEVEELLLAHPGVSQAHVVGVPDEVRGEVLAAFVEPREAGLDAVELQAFVRGRASSFKVPSHVFFRSEEQLPRGATGKIPKQALVDEALHELSQQ